MSETYLTLGDVATVRATKLDKERVGCLEFSHRLILLVNSKHKTGKKCMARLINPGDILERLLTL